MDFFIFISEQWVLTSVLVVLIWLLALSERARGGIPIPASELVALMNADQAILVDVREHKEFSQGHIHGAFNIPYSKVESRASELNAHREKTIVLADKMGQHAGAAGKVLTKLGFNVRRLSGGIMEWSNQSLPLVTKK